MRAFAGIEFPQLCYAEVAKIILVDRDTYAASNLTRQCLGSLADVGRRKVDVAKDGLQAGCGQRAWHAGNGHAGCWGFACRPVCCS